MDMGTPGPSTVYTTEAILSVFEANDEPHEPLTSPEIADELGCSGQTVRNRLNELSEEGEIRTKKVGARSRVWWLP
jgi:predicted ArsR family transcriptional regulator